MKGVDVRLNNLYDKLIMSDDYLNLLYMWIKQSVITRAEFKELIKQLKEKGDEY